MARQTSISCDACGRRLENIEGRTEVVQDPTGPVSPSPVSRFTVSINDELLTTQQKQFDVCTECEDNILAIFKKDRYS